MKKIIAGICAALGLLVIWSIVPPPRQASAQFEQQSTWGGTSGGSANAQTFTIPNLAAYKTGVVLRFNPGFTNTGPTQININGIGLVNVMRPSSIGLVALSGQEIWAGEPTSVMYNGSVFVLTSNVDMTPIGKAVEFRGTSAPRGTLIEDGSCVSQTTYAPLFSVIGTTYGTCGAGLFALPNSKGRLFAALDNQGSGGAAGNITSAGSGCNATVIGNCGQQNWTLTASQIPTINSSVSVSVSASSTVGNIAQGANTTINQPGTGSPSAYPNLSYGAVGSTGSGTGTGSSTNTGGLSHPTLPPISIGLRAIKY